MIQEYFLVKNFLINVFESFSLKLLNKVSMINLYFDESFPEVINGDKITFLFVRGFRDYYRLSPPYFMRLLSMITLKNSIFH
jgi:hypothetical protein